MITIGSDHYEYLWSPWASLMLWVYLIVASISDHHWYLWLLRVWVQHGSQNDHVDENCHYNGPRLLWKMTVRKYQNLILCSSELEADSDTGWSPQGSRIFYYFTCIYKAQMDLEHFYYEGRPGKNLRSTSMLSSTGLRKFAVCCYVASYARSHICSSHGQSHMLSSSKVCTIFPQSKTPSIPSSTRRILWHISSRDSFYPRDFNGWLFALQILPHTNTIQPFNSLKNTLLFGNGDQEESDGMFRALCSFMIHGKYITRRSHEKQVWQACFQASLHGSSAPLGFISLGDNLALPSSILVVSASWKHGLDGDLIGDSAESPRNFSICKRLLNNQKAFYRFTSHMTF